MTPAAAKKCVAMTSISATEVHSKEEAKELDFWNI